MMNKQPTYTINPMRMWRKVACNRISQPTEVEGIQMWGATAEIYTCLRAKKRKELKTAVLRSSFSVFSELLLER